MNWTRQILLGVGLTVVLGLAPAPVRAMELTVAPDGVVAAVFQNGQTYASAEDASRDTSLRASVSTKGGFSIGRHLRFGKLGDWVRGEHVEVLDAKLQLYYYDEWWTKLVYYVAVSRSLDGSVLSIAEKPESSVKILGDKWPAGEKTRRPSWIDFPPWWAAIVWFNSKTKTRLDPWTDPVAFPPFNKPLNCDGRLFYPGTPDAIGGPDLPVSCLRMKALREAIEDYEYFDLLDKLGHTEKEFDINSLHTLIEEKSKDLTEVMALGRDP